MLDLEGSQAATAATGGCMILQWLLKTLFPPKCILCRKLLSKTETDLCSDCRQNAPEFKKSRLRFSYVAGWTSVWYYKDMVRGSIHRFKFLKRRHYAKTYGRILAARLKKDGFMDTWKHFICFKGDK